MPSLRPKRMPAWLADVCEGSWHSQAVRRWLPERIQRAIVGEATLTLGGPLHELAEGEIHGVVIVGPHECMPCKIAEAQYGEAAEQRKLPYVSIGFNGDPMDEEALDRFAYDVHEAFRRGEAAPSPTLAVRAPGAKAPRLRLPVIAEAED